MAEGAGICRPCGSPRRSFRAGGGCRDDQTRARFCASWRVPIEQLLIITGVAEKHRFDEIVLVDDVQVPATPLGIYHETASDR
jgi:hypothetical protein